jgi:flavin-dependent dehydrogenase
VIPSVVRGNVALIGDASGTVDALTGEGLSLGFRHALALADALAQNDLQEYERGHRQIKRPPELMAKLMLLIGGRRAVRRRVLRALAAQSPLFTLMLGVHAGARSLTSVPLASVARFLGHVIVPRWTPDEGSAKKG